MASDFKNLYNKYSSQGAIFILAVGQNAWQGPATSGDAAAYKQSHGYPAGWVAIADPNWQKMDKAIQDKTGTLPNMSVLDGTMKLVHTDTSWSSMMDVDTAIQQAINNQ